MKFSKADHRRIMQAFEDYLEGFAANTDAENVKHRRVFIGLLTRKKLAGWRESAAVEKHRKLPLK